MSRKFMEQLAALKSQVVGMGEITQEMVGQAMRALVERDQTWIDRVIQNEAKVDRLQVEIDDEAVRLMAIQSPVASDLRFILMVVRINTELERVGDLCVNMCENVQLLLSEPQLKPLIDLPKMADLAARMLRDSLQAYLAPKDRKTEEE